MRCVNGCIIKESEQDDAVEGEGGKLTCGRCMDNLFAAKPTDSLRDVNGRYFDKTRKATTKANYSMAYSSPKVRKLKAEK